MRLKYITLKGLSYLALVVLVPLYVALGLTKGASSCIMQRLDKIITRIVRKVEYNAK